MHLELPGVSLAGHFIISTDKRGVLAEFDNLITDGGLSRFRFEHSYADYCFVGSGNTPPANADTQLQNRLAVTSDTYSSTTNFVSAVTPMYASCSRFFEFPIGTAAGNLSEIGAGWFISSGVYGLFSRALILDSEGLPTTITILPTEVLRVVYTVRMYIPEGDTTGTVTLAGNVGGTHNWVLRASGVGQSNYWSAIYGLKASNTFNSGGLIYARSGIVTSITSAPGGTAWVNTSGSGNSNASWGTSVGSITVNSLQLSNYLGKEFQVGFTPAISKTYLQILTLNWSQPTVSRYVAP